MPCMSASIVASTVITHTGNLGATTVYTPSANGFYRISVAVNGGSGAQVFIFFSMSIQTALMEYSGSFPITSAGLNPYPTYWPSGTPIQLSATDSSGFPYDLYVVVEQLA